MLSDYQCGFREGYGPEHCLITLIIKWQKSVENGGAFVAQLSDLSKAFDYSLQTHHMYSTLKRRGNGRFYVVSTWNTCGVFAGFLSWTSYC